MRGELVAHYQTLGRPSREQEPRCAKSGKRTWPTEDAALAAAFEFANQNRFRFDSNSAYRCEHCDGWHLSARRPRR